MNLNGGKIPGGAEEALPWSNQGCTLYLPVALLSAVIFITGCATAPPQPERVTDDKGQVFELVQPAIKDGAFTDIELWERISPQDTNRFYTPSLDWQLHPGNAPSFKSVMK